MSINAQDTIKQRELEEWNSMLDDFLDSPQRSADHLVLGMNREQRDRAKGLDTHSPVPTWV